MLSLLKSFFSNMLEIGKRAHKLLEDRMGPRVHAYASMKPRMPNGHVCGSETFSRNAIVEEKSKTSHLNNRITALVVDNNTVIQHYHKTLLSSFDVHNQNVENGQEAVNLYRNGAYFNLILMDKDMPVMNGPEATRILRAMGVGSMIVGVTSENREEERRDFVESGLDDFVEKPLTREKLISILLELDSRLHE